MTRWLARSWEWWAIGVAALGISSTLLAAGAGYKATPASASLAGGRAQAALIIGEYLDVQAIDPTSPQQGNAFSNLRMYARVYDNLTRMGNTLNLEPDLATSWKQVSRKIWVFNIRRGVRFSNGRAMTISDVVGSLRRFFNPKNFPSSQSLVGSIAASGPWQIRINTTAPNPALPAQLAIYGTVLPMKELAAGTFDPTKQMLGTGPWKVVGHIKDESWTLVRNQYYWRAGLPKVNRLIIKIIPDDAARIAALRTGSIDISVFEKPDAVNLLRGVPNVKSVAQNTSTYDLLVLNSVSGSIFTDVRLRQAVAQAIDRNEIIKLGLAGLGRPTAASPEPFGICKPALMPFAKPDLEAGRRLVAAAGAAGKSIEILVNSAEATQLSVAQVVQQRLNAIGLNANIVSLETGAFFDRWVTQGKFDIAINYFVGFADPAIVLRWYSPVLAGWTTKFFSPNNSELDKLILRSLTTSSGPARDKAIRDACTGIARDAKMIPLATTTSIIGYRSDRLVPRIQPVEGYGVPLRNLPEFTLLKK
jgi:peptide/nickel transport system substrate-binding protein